jgi:hypothetical protein
MIAFSETVNKWLGAVDTAHGRLRPRRRRGRPYLYPTPVVIRCGMLTLPYPSAVSEELCAGSTFPPFGRGAMIHLLEPHNRHDIG